MENLFRFTVLNLTKLCLFYSVVAIFTNQVVAGEAIVDRSCRYHTRTSENFTKIAPQNRGTIYLTSKFQANNQQWFLQVLKFPDATGVFCLVNTNTQKNQRLSQVTPIQNKLIEKVEKLSDQEATYIVTVKGEKNQNIFRTFYKLNLSNPFQPQVVPLVRMYKN